VLKRPKRVHDASLKVEEKIFLPSEFTHALKGLEGAWRIGVG